MKISKTLAVSAALAAVFAQTPVYAQNYYARHQLQVVEGPQGPPAAWETGTWGSWSTTCGDAAMRTRTVLCKKGGELVVDTNCPMFDRPPTTDVQAVTSGCSYQWAARPGSWSQSCGANSVRTTSYVCERSDASVVADGQCASAKPAPITETRTSYDGCKAKDWAVGEWRDMDYCAQGMIRTERTLTCMVNGQPAVESECATTPYPDKFGTAACSSPNHCVSGTQTRKRMSSPDKILIGTATVGTRYTSPMNAIYDFCNRYAGGKLKKCSGESVQVGATTTVTIYGIPATSPEPTITTSASFSDYIFNCAP